jgi:hypothetical protein
MSPIVNDGVILTLDEAADVLRVKPEWLRKSTCPRLSVAAVLAFALEAMVRPARGWA